MKREVKIGLTVVAGVLAAYLALAWVKSIHLFAASRDTYTIQFDHVAGLMEGDPVMVLGYPAGNVTSIGLKNGRMEVSISMKPEIELRSDALAEIQIKELMGGKKVEITPGSQGSVLRPGDAIQGKTSLDFSTAFSRFGGYFESFDPARIDSLFSNLERVTASFADLGQEIQKMETTDLFADLRESVGHLNHMIGKADRADIVGKLDKAFGTLDHMATRADEAMGTVTALSEKLQGKTLPGADSLMAQVGDALNSVEGMMGDFRTILTSLKGDETAAGKFINDPKFAQQLQETVENLDKTLTHIRTKKIFVTMTLSKKQRLFDETPVNEEE